MCLHIEQEIAVRVCVVTFYSTEQAGDINDAGRFFVLRQEVRTACQETAGVVPRLPRCAGFIPALEIHSQRELDLPVGAKTHTLFDSGRHGSENRTTRKR